MDQESFQIEILQGLVTYDRASQSIQLDQTLINSIRSNQIDKVRSLESGRSIGLDPIRLDHLDQVDQF